MKTIKLENGKEIQISDESYKALEEGVRSKRWLPQTAETYYIVDADGIVSGSIWGGDFCDRDRLSILNVYKTKEEAQAHADKLHAIAKVTEYIWNNDLASDDQEYIDKNKYKFFFFYNCCDNSVEIEDWREIKYFSPIPYLKDQKSAEEVLEKFSKELGLIYK